MPLYFIQFTVQGLYRITLFKSAIVLRAAICQTTYFVKMFQEGIHQS